MAMTLEQVVPWGRSLDEYRHMFDLSPTNLASKILGCGDGPASFNAELTAQGGQVISVDPIYAYSREQIEARVNATHTVVVTQVQQTLEDYRWTEFANPAALGRHRLATMQRFLADYAAGHRAGRYRVEALPALSFADDTFDLALCSHFLFLYSEQLDYAFHRAGILELCRVAREVRIFPLLDLKCRLSQHLQPLCVALQQQGYDARVVSVPYEFQRGGNQMLQIARKRSTQ
ncbi:MAG: hypothetical protein R3C14_29380 [Caldilineaceae bacterium]